MDAAGDKRDSAGSLIFPLFFGREYNCVSLRNCKNHLEKIFLKNSTPPEGNLAKSIKAKNALKTHGDKVDMAAPKGCRHGSTVIHRIILFVL